MSKESTDIKTSKELTTEQRRMKKDFAKRGIEVEFSKKPLGPNMKYHDYLECK